MNNKTLLAIAAAAGAVWYFFLRKPAAAGDKAEPGLNFPWTPRPNTTGNNVNAAVAGAKNQQTAAQKILSGNSGNLTLGDATGLFKAAASGVGAAYNWLTHWGGGDTPAPETNTTSFPGYETSNDPNAQLTNPYYNFSRPEPTEGVDAPDYNFNGGAGGTEYPLA